MCGIAGAVFWDQPSPGIDPLKAVQAMTDALAHRGPDGQAVMRCESANNQSGLYPPTVALGHRRLAIIDLTDRARQPMTSQDGTITITFNGEIYNFKELRHELEGYGRHFRSDSDPEVVLQGYEQWGDRVVERLRGMFAFAIWDGHFNKLILARDRLGIKPLYAHAVPSYLLFASEARSLLASGLVSRRVDLVAIDQFLAYQTVPAPRTFIRDVRMLPSSHVVTASRREVTRRSYWDLLTCGRQAQAGSATTDQARAQVQELLIESAALHQISDVPVGIFLSGGIDSSAVAALVRRTGSTPRTFAITCPGTAFDEARYARAAARACGAEHTEIALTETEIMETIRAALTSVDHPSGDGMNTFIVSRAVRETGIKVALSGLGGDEFFGGYPSFGRINRLTSYAKAWGRSPEAVRRIAGAAVRTFGGHSAAATKAAALVESDGTLPQAFPILRQLFSPAQRNDLATPAVLEAARAVRDPYVALLDEAMERHPDLDTMALVSYAEACTYMHDVLLRDTDQMSMSQGLEVRVPLLDHCLVAYLMALPAAAKRDGAAPKPLLVESLGSPLPPECVERPKQGFVLPFELWMRDSLRPLCEHHLGREGALTSGILREDAVATLWTSFLNGDVTWSRPWALVALAAWLETNGITA